MYKGSCLWKNSAARNGIPGHLEDILHSSTVDLQRQIDVLFSNGTEESGEVHDCIDSLFDDQSLNTRLAENVQV